MSRGMTRQRDELHAVDDWLGATKRVPLTGLDVRRHDGFGTLEERLRILRRLSSDFRRQPKVAFCLRDVNIGILERRAFRPEWCARRHDPNGGAPPKRCRLLPACNLLWELCPPSAQMLP